MDITGALQNSALFYCWGKKKNISDQKEKLMVFFQSSGWFAKKQIFHEAVMLKFIVLAHGAKHQSHRPSEKFSINFFLSKINTFWGRKEKQILDEFAADFRPNGQWAPQLRTK